MHDRQYTTTNLFMIKFLYLDKKKINYDLLKLNGIEPTGYFHYVEQFPKINGEQMVRLAVIYAINNLPINEILIEKTDFDKNIVERHVNN